MSDRRLKGFGSVNDQSEDFKPKEGGGSNLIFGLNQGVKLEKFEYNDKASSDGSPANAIDVTLDVNGAKVMNRFFEITKVYDADKGGAVEDDGSQAWADAYNQTVTQMNATLTHIVKATGTTQAQIDAALKNEVGFVDYAKIMESLAKLDNATDLDFFAQYQWKIPSGKDKTYLEMPSNMKGGYFLVPHVPVKGQWTEEREWEVVIESENDGEEKTIKREGLRYVDSENPKNIHPFERNQNFMESKKAIQQIKGQNSGAGKGIKSSLPASGGMADQPKSSGWDD